MDIAHSHQTDTKKFSVFFDNYDKQIKDNVLQEISNVQKTNINITQKENNFLYEVGEVCKRASLNFNRNPILLRTRIIQTLVMAFLVCALFFQLDSNPNNQRNITNRMGSLFFILISNFMTSMMSVLLTFPSERAVFLKEQGSNMYSVSAYFLGRSVTELPFITIFPFIFACIVYWIIGYNNDNPGKFFIFGNFDNSLTLNIISCVPCSSILSWQCYGSNVRLFV